MVTQTRALQRFMIVNKLECRGGAAAAAFLRLGVCGIHWQTLASEVAEDEIMSVARPGPKPVPSRSGPDPELSVIINASAAASRLSSTRNLNASVRVNQVQVEL
jgi:hypothetical protein